MLSHKSRQLSRLLTNCNGERRHGSRNKTPYMGVPIRQPPLVAQILQLARAHFGWGKVRRREPREQIQCTPVGSADQEEEVHEGTRERATKLLFALDEKARQILQSRRGGAEFV